MICNRRSKVSIPLSLLAISSVAFPTAVFGQGMVSIMPSSGNGYNQQTPAGQSPMSVVHPGPIQAQPPMQRPSVPAPAAGQPTFTVTFHPTNPVVNVGTANPMYRQPTWPSPWNYIYPNSDGSLGYTPVNSNNGGYLGGYYYGGYCESPSYPSTYPSVYSAYSGLPQYISDPGYIIIGDPYSPDYITSYQPFNSQPAAAPTAVTYNQNNYNTNNYYLQAPAPQSDAAKDSTTPTHASFDAGSYQAAFTDIEKAWVDGDINLIQSHLRDSDTKISVNLKGKYAYSIGSDDFVKITRDAFSNLNTVSFEFTRLRKAKNGDVTAYGTHTYLAVTQASAPTSSAKGSSDDSSATVPFDQPDNSSPSSSKDSAGSVVTKKVYVSFTLRQGDSQWYIVALDSSTSPLVPDQD